MIGALGTAFAADLAAEKSAKDTTPKPWSMKCHGFVNPHFYADSRQVVGGREEMMLFYPKPQAVDPATGVDINDGWNRNLLSITARVNLTLTGPDILGAKTKAFMEGDFTGSTNATNNNLRLRHAYIDMDWGHSAVLAGQYWYPMVVQEIMPNTRPLNMGAPFHPYARYNQLRLTERIGSRFEAVLVALFQQDNMSQGMLDNASESSSQFVRQANMPEMHLQLRYKGDKLFAGAAANMLTIQPRVYTSLPAAGLNADYGQTFTNFSYTAFLKYKMNGWALSAQTLLNNSLYEGCSMGGYIEHQDLSSPLAPAYSYSSWHFNTVWLDLGQTTGKWRTGIFVGAAKNMDFGKEMSDIASGSIDNAFGRGFNMEYLWRVQPRIGYHANERFNIYAEAEYTRAQYGKLKSLANSHLYEHDDDGGVGNLRLMLSAEYHF